MSPDVAVHKRSVTIAGHRTSVSLENAFWSGVAEIAAERGITPTALIAEIDAGRSGGNLSSAIRVAVLEHFRHRRS